jgi:hypothetical protein
LYNIDLENKSGIIKSGKADVVFVIDTTGSMSSPIRNVRDNINQFVAKLEENNVDIRLGLVEYRDIYADGIGSTKSYDWYTEVLDFKTKLASLGISGGGDTPESAVDALHCAQNMKFRTGVKKYIILVTDANYKNGIVGDSSVTMQDEIDSLAEDDIVTSVITNPYYYLEYNPLIINTDGVVGNIVKNFAIELEPLIDKMIEKVNNGCWVRLSNGEIVYLDKDPSLGDEKIDTDKDGVPDIMELKSTYEIQVFNPYTYTYELIEMWTFFSNPAKDDTDGDGLYDIDDLRPSIFDTVVLADTELVTVFNTGRSWYKIACNSFDYLDNLFYTVDLRAANSIPLDTFSNALHNSEQSFNLDELTYIGLINNEGSKIYLHNKSGDLRETIFRRITNKESKYFKHSGILKWEKWEEVPKGTKSGFFKGKVLSEADINFSLEIYYVVDVYTVLNSIVYAGAVVIIVIVALKATPVVLANIQGIIYYVKTFGVVEGLKMYQYLGIGNLPDSVITWIQWDVADGDSSLDDVGSVVVESGNGIVKQGLGKISGKEYTVTQKGLNNVRNYLTEQGFIDDYENQAMLSRLSNAMKNGVKITGADAVFYTHELKEAQLVALGTEQLVAHKIALKFYEVSPFSVYHPEVIKMNPSLWNKSWFDFWNIEG